MAYSERKIPHGQDIIGISGYLRTSEEDALIETYKVHNFAKGFKQNYDIDHTDNGSLVVKCMTIRMVVAVYKYLYWLLNQLDAVTAFLYGAVKENTYCAVPEGVAMDSGHDCMEAVKPIYVLKKLHGCGTRRSTNECAP